MHKPSDYPVRWTRGFGWGTWRAFLRLCFPGRQSPMAGYTLLPIRQPPWWWLTWPYWQARRISWAMRGPV